MPQVPRYSSQGTSSGPLNARVSAQAPIEAFGGGQSANAYSGFSDMVGSFARIAERETLRANEIINRDTENKLMEVENEIIHGKSGALSQTGKNALESYDYTSKAWAENVERIKGDLSNQSQKDFLDNYSQKRWGHIDQALQKHMVVESNKYDDEVMKTYVENQQNSAMKNFTDMGRVADSLASIKVELQKYGDRRGIDKSVVDQMSLEASSKTHSLVLSRFLDAKQDSMAKEYLEANKAEFVPADLLRAEQHVEQVTLLAQSQNNADKMWASAGGDMGRALNEARKIETPELRKATEDLIVRRNAFEENGRKQTQENAYYFASEFVKKAPGQAPQQVVPASTWAALSLSQQKALSNYNEDPPNDNKRWLDFMTMPAQSIASMSREEFETQYWTNFDSSHRSRAEHMYLASRSQGADHEALTNSLSFNEQVHNTLAQAKVIPVNRPKNKWSEDEAMLAVSFESDASKALEQFEKTELGGKRKASPTERQKVLDEMISKKVFVDKSWFWQARMPEEVPYYSIPVNKRGDAFVPFDKISKTDMDELKGFVANAKKPPTREMYERLMAAVKLKDRDAFLKILKEQ